MGEWIEDDSVWTVEGGGCDACSSVVVYICVIVVVRGGFLFYRYRNSCFLLHALSWFFYPSIEKRKWYDT